MTSYLEEYDVIFLRLRRHIPRTETSYSFHSAQPIDSRGKYIATLFVYIRLYSVVKSGKNFQNIIGQITEGFLCHPFRNFIVSLGNRTRYTRLRISVAVAKHSQAYGFFKTIGVHKATQRNAIGTVS